VLFNTQHILVASRSAWSGPGSHTGAGAGAGILISKT